MPDIIFHIKTRNGGLREADRASLEDWLSSGKLPPGLRAVSVDGGRMFMTAPEALAIGVLSDSDLVYQENGDADADFINVDRDESRPLSAAQRHRRMMLAVMSACMAMMLMPQIAIGNYDFQRMEKEWRIGLEWQAWTASPLRMLCLFAPSMMILILSVLDAFRPRISMRSAFTFLYPLLFGLVALFTLFFRVEAYYIDSILFIAIMGAISSSIILIKGDAVGGANLTAIGGLAPRQCRRRHWVILAAAYSSIAIANQWLIALMISGPPDGPDDSFYQIFPWHRMVLLGFAFASLAGAIVELCFPAAKSMRSALRGFYAIICVMGVVSIAFEAFLPLFSERGLFRFFLPGSFVFYLALILPLIFAALRVFRGERH